MSLDLVECASRASARNKKTPAMRVVGEALAYSKKTPVLQLCWFANRIKNKAKCKRVGFYLWKE